MKFTIKETREEDYSYCEYIHFDAETEEAALESLKVFKKQDKYQWSILTLTDESHREVAKLIGNL